MKIIESVHQEGSLAKIGVIVPTVNAGAVHVKECIASLSEFSAGVEMKVYLVENDYEGFPKACNAGMRRAFNDGCEAVILLNDDTEIMHHDWVRTLWQNSKGRAIVGCHGTKITAPFGMSFPALAFWCVLIPRSVWNELGQLDESFGLGNSEDLHYCYKAWKAGIEVKQEERVWVHHKISKTFRSAELKDKFEGLKKDNMMLLLQRIEELDK